jgi:predicted nucleic acid-binding protein
MGSAAACRPADGELMTAVVLDTTVLIDVLRGRPAAQRVRELMAQREMLLTTAINVEEIVRGLRDSETSAFGNLMAGLLVVPVQRNDGERAGRWRRDFASRGITLHQADCLIAAVAVGVRARLATGNPKDFPMSELAVEEWPVGR